MKVHAFTILAVLLAASVSLRGQDLTIANARIIVSNGTVIERGSIVVRGGKIVSVATGAPSSPAGQVIAGHPRSDCQTSTTSPASSAGSGRFLPFTGASEFPS